MSYCRDIDLHIFSFNHYTYINQIFGDQTVRQIITEVFPNKLLKFDVEETNENFENSHHHILIKNKTNEIICSVNSGFQNLNVNKNDTLCQSYSLLTYFNKNIDESQRQRQMDMIKLYRRIIKNKKFLLEFKNIIIPENTNIWIDYSISTNTDKKYIEMNKRRIISKIKTILDDWETYGYWYFIGDGKCQIVSSDNKNKSRKNKKTM